MKILSNKQWKEIEQNQLYFTKENSRLNKLVRDLRITADNSKEREEELIKEIAKLESGIKKLENQVGSYEIEIEQNNITIQKSDETITILRNEIKDLKKNVRRAYTKKENSMIVTDIEKEKKEIKKATKKVQENTIKEVKKTLSKGITKENKVKSEFKKRGRKPKNNVNDVEVKNEDKKSKKN